MIAGKVIPIPVAFWAKDRGEAERQAIEWARAEPRFVDVRVMDAAPNAMHPERWTVTLECTIDQAQQEFGL